MEKRELLLEVLATVQAAQKVAKNLNTWSWLDFFSDSWLFGMIKRNKVTQLNQSLLAVRQALRQLQSAYPEVVLGNVQGMSERTSDWVWDVWLDNPFTDFRVHREIKAIRKQLDTLESTIRQQLSAW